MTKQGFGSQMPLLEPTTSQGLICKTFCHYGLKCKNSGLEGSKSKFWQNHVIIDAYENFGSYRFF